MSGMKKAQALLEKVGTSVSVSKEKYSDASKIKEVILVQATERGALETWSEFKSVTDAEYSDARYHLEEFHQTDRDHFLGKLSAARKALDGELDLTPFRKAQSKIAGVLKVEELETLSAKKRSRYLSEHDGEFDFDRQFDLAPFNATRPETGGVQRVLDINVDFTFNGGVTTSEIEEYGALAWAIVELVERAGIQVNLNIVTQLNQLAGAAVVEKGGLRSDLVDTKTIVNIKKAGDYSDALSIVRCFTPWFYRRIIWSTWCVATQARGLDTTGSLGSCEGYKSSASLGVLNIGSETINGGAMNYTKLANFLRQALGLSLQDAA